MSKRIRAGTSALVLAAWLCGPSAHHVARAAGLSEEQAGKLALAEEFAVAAREAGVPGANDSKDVARAKIQLSAALLKAACVEYNVEPRFPRLLAEACLQLGDRDGEIDALARYRRIQLPEVQHDEFAQVRYIDLNAAALQDDAAKIAYLQQLVGIQAVSENVRSHIAFELSKLLADKFDKKGAQDMLAKAIELNPLNGDALQAKYTQMQSSAAPADRVAALVALLKCNPARPDYLGALADALASAGQMDAAADWYKRGFDVATQIGEKWDAGRYLDYAAALQITGQPRKAAEATAMVLTENPANARAAILQLLIARQMVNAPIAGSQAADQQALAKAKQAALAAITAQLGSMHAQLNGANAAASTRPAATKPTDIVGVVDTDLPRLKKIKALPNANQTQTDFLDTYSAALSNLIWYYVYFDPQPAKADALLPDFAALVPANDTELTRLQGFAYLAANKKDEARVKLSAVALDDPLADMGMILLDPAASGAADEASRLVSKYPSGLIGATLIDGLRDKGGKFVADDSSKAAADALKAFPIDLLSFLVNGQAQRFYTLLARPLRAGVHFDEPVLVQVTIQDTGNVDLAIGDNGAIRPDLWFDATTQGGTDPRFDGVAFDHIAGPLVLKAHHLEMPGTSQIVRIDQGDMADYLTKHPTIAMSLLCSVFVNPFRQPAGVAPGPGGYRQQFATPMERQASPISTPQQVQDVTNAAINGRADEKIHGLQLLGSYVIYLRDQIKGSAKPAAGAATAAPGTGGMPAPGNMPPKAIGNQPNSSALAGTYLPIISIFTAAIQADLRDPTPIVGYWAQYQTGTLSNDADRLATALVMVQGKDWEQRVLGLMLASTLAPDSAKQVAAIAAGNSSDYVKSLADAMVTVANAPPVTPAKK